MYSRAQASGKFPRSTTKLVSENMHREVGRVQRRKRIQQAKGLRKSFGKKMGFN